VANRPAPGLVDLLQIGAVCGIIIGLGVFAGYLVDRAAGTPPLFTFVGLAVGIVGAATGSYRVIRPFVSGASDRASMPLTPERGVEDTAPRGATDQKD
jgi:F0F1-type ATP synthase assembly protein I